MSVYLNTFILALLFPVWQIQSYLTYILESYSGTIVENVMERNDTWSIYIIAA